MAAGLGIEIEHDQGILFVRLDGRLDAASSPLLEKKLVELTSVEKAKVLLDFAKINYLSSAGMRLLLSTTKKLTKNAGGLHLCSVNEEVMEIIKMAGFERIIHIFPTEQEAIYSFLNQK